MRPVHPARARGLTRVGEHRVHLVVELCELACLDGETGRLSAPLPGDLGLDRLPGPAP